MRVLQQKFQPLRLPSQLPKCQINNQKKKIKHIADFTTHIYGNEGLIK